jgi:sugar phosphate isomerase/epimerase
MRMTIDSSRPQDESRTPEERDGGQGMDRRTFVRRAGAAGMALAATAAAGPLASSALGAANRGRFLVPRHRIAIGLEEYAFSQQPPADVYSKLGEIREIGYKGVELIEFNGFGSIERAREVRHQLREARLRGLGNFHLTFATPRNLRNDFEALVAEDKAAGMDNLGMVAAEFSPEWQNEEGYKRQAEDFNRWGEYTKKNGMLFYVHNERWVYERDPTTGKVLFDVWIEETDPDLVFFELDVMWIEYTRHATGVDSVHYINLLEQDDRLLYFHIKDWNGQQAAPGAEPSTTQTDVGQGVIDFRRIFQAIEKPYKYWYIVEREGSPDPTRTARGAYEYLSTLT